jgi:hypothetical protein
LGFAFGAVAVVDVGVVFVVVVVAPALVVCVVLDVEEADPHALTINVSRTAASGMRSRFMVL